MPDRDVVAEIYKWCQASHFPFELACCIVAGESDFDPSRVGDAGRSFGVIQVFTPVHGGTQADWGGLAGVVRSLDQMKSRWLGAMAKHGSAEWESWPQSMKVVRFAQMWVDMQGCEWPTLLQVNIAIDRGIAVAKWYRDTEEIVPVPRPEITQFAVTAVSGARLRDAPSQDGNVLGVIPRGEMVRVLADEYIPVMTPRGAGWIHGSLLMPVLPPQQIGISKAALKAVIQQLQVLTGE